MGKSRDELGLILRHMYDDAAEGEKVAHIHLFGIKYAEDIQAAGMIAREVIQASGLKASYQSELSKAMKLAKYVVPRARYAD